MAKDVMEPFHHLNKLCIGFVQNVGYITIQQQQA